jgi:hypothetical protein
MDFSVSSRHAQSPPFAKGGDRDIKFPLMRPTHARPFEGYPSIVLGAVTSFLSTLAEKFPGFPKNLGKLTFE